MAKNLRTVLFEVNGAEFLCIPYLPVDRKPQYYKLCWVKKISDNIHIISFEYEVIHVARSIKQAKEIAKMFLEYFSK